MAFAERSPARHSRYPRNPIHARKQFRGFHSSHICYGLPVCSPPCTDPTSFLTVGDFYIQASGVSVTLPAAGYDYSSDWTPLLAGLSPARMAASLAAPDHLAVIGIHFRFHWPCSLQSEGNGSLLSHRQFGWHRDYYGDVGPAQYGYYRNSSRPIESSAG